MQVDLVHVETADDVRLDGALRTPAAGPDGTLPRLAAGLDGALRTSGAGLHGASRTPSAGLDGMSGTPAAGPDGALRTPSAGLDGASGTPPVGPDGQLGLDLVICHHGVAGNFYNPYFFDDLGAMLLEQGCAVLRVNSRGHDQAYRGPRGKLGAEYEVVDDCRLDWRAWLDFAESAGYRRIGVWGHSLGAVKTIYYASVERDPRVVCAVASSPPRFSYAAYLASDQGARFKADMDRARHLVATGQPAASIAAAVPLVTAFTARTYVDKYGPDGRYDILDRLPTATTPLLLTLGELEIGGLAFRDLAEQGPTLHQASPQVTYQLIPGADHSYATRVPELWATFRGWLLKGAGIAPLTAGPRSA